MDPIEPVPRLLHLRVPAYELPDTTLDLEAVKLLQFGAALVEVQPFAAPKPDTSDFFSTA